MNGAPVFRIAAAHQHSPARQAVHSLGCRRDRYPQQGGDLVDPDIRTAGHRHQTAHLRQRNAGQLRRRSHTEHKAAQDALQEPFELPDRAGVVPRLLRSLCLWILVHPGSPDDRPFFRSDEAMFRQLNSFRS
jgi:hypothetical protein